MTKMKKKRKDSLLNFKTIKNKKMECSGMSHFKKKEEQTLYLKMNKF